MQFIKWDNSKSYFSTFPLIKSYLIYILILLSIYPLSPILFNKFLGIKEAYFIPPVNKNEIGIRSDVYGEGHFGARRSGGRRKHKGLDISADIGESVLASKSGITKTGFVKDGMGKYVKISHKNNFVTIYGHLDKIAIKDSQWVWQGAKVGEVGKTGNANYSRMNSHLHFEIRQGDVQKDPMTMFDPKNIDN